MTFEEWAILYPVKTIDHQPEYYIFKCDTYKNAENLRDMVETRDEVASEVLFFNNTYYVIYKN